MAKVLHVFDHSFPVADGYAYRSGEIVRFQRKRGLQTVHVTSAKQGRSSADVQCAGGLEFYRTHPAEGWLSRIPLLEQWRVVSTLRRRLSEIVSSEAPDLLHVHSPCLNGLAALPVGRRAGIPIVYEVRSLWEDAAVDSGACTEGDLRYRVSRALETRVCKQADHVVTICEGLRSEIACRGVSEGHITIAPNSVDLGRFSAREAWDAQAASRMSLTRGEVLGFIGTFFPFEGLDVLLRAVPAILQQRPSVRVLLVGDGPEDARMRRLAQELHIEHALIFAGRVPHDEVERFYDLIDVLVYPRVPKRITDLVTPLKPLEAMAQGKLVLASDVGGHKEMVFDGINGVLFRAGDPASLAQVCIALFDSKSHWPALRSGGQQYVAEKRSWDVTVDIYCRLYERLLNGRH